MTWNPESNTVLDSLTWGVIRKKFKGVAHSNENIFSKFCLNVLKLMIWTGSIYFNANLTFSFACLSKNNLMFRRSNLEQTFSLNESYFLFLYYLPHPRAWPTSKLSILGESREVTRERTRVRGDSPLSRAFSRGFKLPYAFLCQTSICEQWTWINLRTGLKLSPVYKRIPRNIDNENFKNEALSLLLGVTKFGQLKTKII